MSKNINLKIGDWVREKNSNFIIQVYEDMIEDNFELWEPTKGELCVFWQYEGSLRYVITRYKRTTRYRHFNMEDTCSFARIAPLEFVKTIKRK